MRTITPEGAERQAQAGLPPEFLHNLVMMFDGMSQTLVLHFWLARKGFRVPFLFVRGPRASAYASVMDMIGAETLRSLDPGGEESDVLGIETPMLGPDGSLYFLLHRHRPERGGTILAAARLTLEPCALEFWTVDRTSPDACAPVELIGADASGFFAKTGFKASEGSGYRVEYAAAHFDWVKRSVVRLTPLPDVFF